MAVAVGVLTDVDHLIDVFDGIENNRPRHMMRPFHAWEFAALGVLALFLAALLGYVSHLVLDELGNATHSLAYFITYRALVKFKRSRLTPVVYGPTHWAQGDLPAWARYEPTAYRLWRWYKARRPREN